MKCFKLFSIRTVIIGNEFLTAFVICCVFFAKHAFPDKAIAVQGNNEVSETVSVAGVCPPFYLMDETGDIINPISSVNDKAPYSPRKTCGACHDYDKITEGFHFMQGAGEKPTAEQAERCQWVSTPGNYGGTWCSPAPLYRYLSPKKNSSARTMDMTSFSFITAECGVCHPGGGSMEFDREGKRYDVWMSDPNSGLVPGDENNFDGDYYQALWSKTGVLEADCGICHLPEYDFAERKAQLERLNFRWTATAGAKLGKVVGAVKNAENPIVAYNKDMFDSEGKLSLHLVPEPRNEACLNCHAKPGWKKRGSNFRARTDVHLRAGLKCVDCHPAASSADDPRINGKEVHQIGKGDDPGGHVRDDLDNTCRTCDYCHSTGYLGAPIAKHKWLPSLHLDRLSCQACHIPERMVKAAQFQASDVFNPGTKIPTKGKYLWTFYGPDMKYWNHYGDLEMMGYDDKPTEPYRPVLAKYKEKIYPVNRVHTAWPAIEVIGQSGLMQPKMGDIYGMWVGHQADSTKYPELGKITDDNGDGVPEINRPEEIDAIIASVTEMLRKTNYPMEGKRVVWAMDDRVYSSGMDYQTIKIESWEASPFGNVHKYNHDVYPARAALGSNGCSDCHGSEQFFFAPVLYYPFNEGAESVFIPQTEILGYKGKPRQYTGVAAWTATFFRWFTIIVVVALICHIVLDFQARIRLRKAERAAKNMAIQSTEKILRFDVHLLSQHFLLMVSVTILILSAVFLWGLRYPGAHWANTLTGLVGGIDFWRVIHRVGGSLLIFMCGYHIIYILIHPEGRRNFVSLLPRWRDFSDCGYNLMWFFGVRNERPSFGRFTYFEKFDYWAVFWGCAIMIISGLSMWFPSMVRRLLPTAMPSFFDVAKEAHAHEALLAVLAIVIWHLYNVHIRPDRFPGTLFFLHGRMSSEELYREHPSESKGQ